MLHSESKRKTVVGLWGLLALLICIGGPSQLLAQANLQDADVANGEQILVLKNGQMLIGRIEQDAASLIVHVRQGSRLVIAKAKAEFVCNSKSEAFWGKSARIRASDVEQQVNLFRWCLQHELFEHAESQLNILMNSDVSATELASLNRQLTVLRSSQARKQQQQIAEATKANPSNAGGSSNRSQRLPKASSNEQLVDTMNDRMVQQASFSAPLKQPRSTTPPLKPLSKIAKTNERGFSKVAAIPDLKKSHRLRAVAPVAIDPYDPASFNAETARRKTTQ